jgi:hypothetical protein
VRWAAAALGLARSVKVWVTEGQEFFSEEKNQKALTSCNGSLVRDLAGNGSKSFLLLFFKKEVLSFFLVNHVPTS